MNNKLALAIRRQLTAARLAAAVSSLGSLQLANAQQAAPLPQPCGGSCVGAPGFVSSGSATYVTVPGGNIGTVTQATDRAILNWQSFNIDAGHTVNFQQPSTSSAALNRIYQNDASKILGSLIANGQVYLINSNGILFGQGAQVNTGALVASTLNMSNEVFNNLGITGAINATPNALAAFEGAAALGAKIKIEAGATLTSGERVFLIAPEIENRGTINTPDGQTILAASKDRVYVASDRQLRGLLVEVGTGGTVENFGDIISERGNTTLVGLAVNQSGRIRATTSVNVNGSIRLVAQDGARANTNVDDPTTTVLDRKPGATRTGTLTFGEGSVTEVLPDSSTQTAVDLQAQPLSVVQAGGRTIEMQRNARITATGGNVTLLAGTTPGGATGAGTAIHLAEGAVIDVSGDDSAVVAMARNQASIRLFGNELADAPIQRDGPLARQEITVDLREGTDIINTASMSSLRDAVKRTAAERLSVGGQVTLGAGGGDVVLNPGSSVNFSGGQVRYLDGYLNTTKLVTLDGKLVDIGAADPGVEYAAIYGRTAASSDRWGSTPESQSTALAKFHQGYVEGKDAGSLTINGSRVALNGDLQGGIVSGALQRNPTTTLATGETRNYTEVPLRGLLSISGTPNLVLDNSGSAQTYSFGSALPNLPVTISTQALQNGGINRLDLSSTASIVMPADTTLQLAGGADIKLSSSRVSIDGDIASAGGKLRVNATGTEVLPGQIDIGATADINLSGQWVNDALDVQNGVAVAPLFVNGGSARFNAEGNLTLASGSRVDVSAGAQQSTSGRLKYGNAGTIALSSKIANSNVITTLDLGGTLLGFGFKQGGSLEIAAPSLRISQAGGAPATAGEVSLSSQLFNNSGFASYKFDADRGDFTVTDGTQVLLSPLNWQLTGNYRQRATGTELSALTNAVVLPELQRGTSNFAATVTRNNLVSNADATLRIGDGARIETERAGSITLSSDSDLYVNGTLRAAGGTIDLSIQKPELPSNDVAFRADQALRLGSAAVLDVSGVSRVITNDLGQRQGDITDGGTISLRAARGYIIADSGSRMDVSGTQQVFDLPGADNGRLTATTLASDAGTIRIQSAEGAVLSGDLMGLAGGDGAAGGTFDLELDDKLRILGPDLSVYNPPFPVTPREINVGENYNIALGFGTAVPTQLNGKAFVSAERLRDGGFDAIDLSVANSGSILFDGDVTLSAGRRISLDARVIASNGGTAKVNGAYVAMGPAVLNGVATQPIAGTGRLEVNANHLDLFGVSVLSGFAAGGVDPAIALNSSGDIRMIASRQDNAVRPGSLTTLADVRLSAAQIYPATLTDFSINVLGSNGRILIERNNTAANVPLSAGGVLRLSAADIIQNGVLRAPFGELHLNGARSVQLGSASVTSTSGAGVVVPFGTQELGTDWVYPLGNKQLLVTGSPQQNVVLSAPSVELSAGSQVDIRGGGDLLSYEFVKGPGGSQDILLGNNPEGAFAVLPAASLFGAYDPIESLAAGIDVGSTIYLAGGNGLPAGEYARLPARYALLPGAYLVMPVAGTRDIQPGVTATLPDGVTPLVAGRNGYAGTDIQETRWSGYAVLNADQLKQRAEYAVDLASTFFTTSSNPGDAGNLTLDAAKAIRLDGQLLSATTNGRAAQVDIVADSLAVVNARTTATSRVELVASELQNFGAASLLLGGQRSTSGATTQLNVQAQDVAVEGGVTLSAAEIVLAAQQTVTVASGARLNGTGASDAASDTQTTFVVNGNGALARVAAGDQVRVQRNNSNSQSGVVTIAEGAILDGAQSVTLEASRDVLSRGDLLTNGGSLSLTAAQISLGQVPVNTSGLTLSNDDLARFQAGELLLNSRSSIDLYGAVAADLQSVQLDAAGLRGFANDGAAVSITADALSLGNSRNLTTGAAGTGNGTLNLSAAELTLKPGTFDISGFDTAQLVAARELVGDGTTALRMRGDLLIETPRLSGTAGANVSIAADGSLTTASSVIPSNMPVVDALGARLTLTGQSVTHDTTIDLPSGLVTLQASGAGGVSLGSSSVIAVGGRDIDFRELVVGSPGGVVNLVADQGAINIADRAVIDVAGAAAGGAAGSVTMRAATGAVQLGNGVVLRGAAATGEQQGSFAVEAQALASSFSALNNQLNVGGFVEQRKIALQTGNINVAAGETINARNLDMATDGGSISLAGRINAVANEGGRVRLSARDSVTLQATSVIDARATGRDAEGGSVELATLAGTLAVQGAINVSGTDAAGNSAANGYVSLRAPRIGETAVAVAPVTGSVAGAERIEVEAFRSYSATQIDATLVDTIRADNTAYMSNAASIKNALGIAADARYHLLSGVDISSATDLTLNTAWNLFDWREGGEAGVLTLRAARNLNLNQTLSDGFALGSVGDLQGTPLAERDIVQTGPSWSYRLVAGARPSGDALGVTSGTGSVTVAGDVHIRTGTGAIDVVAGDDVVLSTGTSAIYTIGENRGAGVVDPVDAEVFLRGDFVHNGGDVRIAAGGDVRGVSDRPFTDWQPRVAGALPEFYSIVNGRPELVFPAIWAIDPSKFQGVGALGGGNVSVVAGGNLQSLTLALPTTGQANGINGSDTDIAGGGNLRVSAAGDITGGNIVVDKGSAKLTAGGAITVAGSQNGLAPIVQLSDAEVTLQARTGVSVAAVFSPQKAAQDPNQGLLEIFFSALDTSFFGYTDRSALNLVALSGDTVLKSGDAAYRDMIGSTYGYSQGGTSNANPDNYLIYPGSLSARALQRDVRIEGAINLFPATNGNLELLAGRNVTTNGNGSILQSDADIDLLPTLRQPTLIPATTWTSVLSTHANTPVHLLDADPSIIVARTGSVFPSTVGNASASMLFELSEQVRIFAGEDVDRVTLNVQHSRPDDVTIVEAGRDIVYPTVRRPDGALNADERGIKIAGPGNVDLVSGRHISFGSAKGIETIGNSANAALPNGGANINIWTGQSTRPDYAGFTQRYLAESQEYATDLHGYMAEFIADPQLSDLENFRSLSEYSQRRFIARVLYSELKQGGLDGFTAGFDAIKTLFPSLDTNAYRGDLTSFLSYIRTVDGGDINMMVPNGLINAGVASSGGLTKSAGDLGVVVQQAGNINAFVKEDFLVNASRVFSLDGGDILIWSSEGNIDAGRGSKAALSIPPPTTVIDAEGNVTVEFPAAVSGSGIRTAVSTPGRAAGDVFLFAPQGVVDAGDAGIVSAGNITIAATRVVGADNIQVGGTAVGVPVSSGGLGASLTGVSSTANSATNTTSMTEGASAKEEQKASVAEAAISWLEVFVIGLGEEGCKQDDLECLKRQK